MSKAFDTVIQRFAGKHTFSVVAHSFGSAVTTYTLSHFGHKAGQLAFLTSPNRLLDVFEEYRNVIGLGNQAYYFLLDKASHLLNENLENISVEKMGAKMSYRELLMLHDEFDKIIPFANSVRIQSRLKNTSLISFVRIGHYRMLWNEEVISNLGQFIGNVALPGSRLTGAISLRKVS